jgi:anti-sigma B factor antagonist
MTWLMSPQPSRLSIAPAGAGSLVVTGVIDSHTAGNLLDQLRELGPTTDVELDLSGVEFIDSSGLRTIVTVHQELEAADHRLWLVGSSDAVERLLEITGLRDHLHLR